MHLSADAFDEQIWLVKSGRLLQDPATILHPDAQCNR